MRLPRWLHRAYAWAFGYFWLPCTLCGHMMGGHEWDGSAIPTGSGTGRGICSTCDKDRSGLSDPRATLTTDN